MACGWLFSRISDELFSLYDKAEALVCWKRKTLQKVPFMSKTNPSIFKRLPSKRGANLGMDKDW